MGQLEAPPCAVEVPDRAEDPGNQGLGHFLRHPRLGSIEQFPVVPPSLAEPGERRDTVPQVDQHLALQSLPERFG